MYPQMRKTKKNPQMAKKNSPDRPVPKFRFHNPNPIKTSIKLIVKVSIEANIKRVQEAELEEGCAASEKNAKEKPPPDNG